MVFRRVVRVYGERLRVFRDRSSYERFIEVLKAQGYVYDRVKRLWVKKYLVVPLKGYEKRFEDAVKRRDVEELGEIPVERVRTLWRGSITILFMMNRCYFGLNVQYWDDDLSKVDLDRLEDYALRLLHDLTGWVVDGNWVVGSRDLPAGRGVQQVEYRDELVGRLEWWIDLDPDSRPECWQRLRDIPRGGYEYRPFG